MQARYNKRGIIDAAGQARKFYLKEAATAAGSGKREASDKAALVTLFRTAAEHATGVVTLDHIEFDLLHQFWEE